MLYDNTQLDRVYLQAWQITRDESYGRVAEHTLNYVAREMTDPRGGFYSSHRGLGRNRRQFLRVEAR